MLCAALTLYTSLLLADLYGARGRIHRTYSSCVKVLAAAGHGRGVLGRQGGGSQGSGAPRSRADALPACPPPVLPPSVQEMYGRWGFHACAWVQHISLILYGVAYTGAGLLGLDCCAGGPGGREPCAAARAGRLVL